MAAVDPHHAALHSAAQALCGAFHGSELRRLTAEQQQAIDNLALLAGMTHLPWWPLNRTTPAPDLSRCPVCGCPTNSADCQRSHP
jgi:hypothetical protein